MISNYLGEPPYIFLIWISHLIPLWLEKLLYKILVFLKFLRLILWLIIYLLNVLCAPQERIVEWSVPWLSIRSIWLMVLVRSSITLWFFQIALSIMEKGLLKSPTRIIDLFISSSSFVSFCFVHVEAVLFCTYTTRLCNYTTVSVCIYPSQVITLILNYYFDIYIDIPYFFWLIFVLVLF